MKIIRRVHLSHYHPHHDDGIHTSLYYGYVQNQLVELPELRYLTKYSIPSIPACGTSCQNSHHCRRWPIVFRIHHQLSINLPLSCPSSYCTCVQRLDSRRRLPHNEHVCLSHGQVKSRTLVQTVTRRTGHHHHPKHHWQEPHQWHCHYRLPRHWLQEQPTR